MQTANFVSQWNKFSSLDCVWFQTVSGVRILLSFRFRSAEFIQTEQIWLQVLQQCTKEWKNNNKAMTFKLNPIAREMKWTQIDCGKPLE